MEYNAEKSKAILVGLLQGAVIWSFLIWGINYSLGPGDVLLRLMLLIPAYISLAIYCFLLLGLFRLSYYTDDKALIINWGLGKKIIFLDQIEEIVVIKGEANFFSVFSGGWSGYMAGLYQMKGAGPVKMYATNIDDGFLYIKTKQGFYGITPRDQRGLAGQLSAKTNRTIATIDMNELPVEITGDNYYKNTLCNSLRRMNYILLLAYGVYLAYIMVFLDSINPFIVLLLVLALVLFFFNSSNAKRLFFFTTTGGYILLMLSLIITSIFFFLTIAYK